MPNKVVDVFDPAGAKLFSYSIALEDANCVNAEFEEVALILAESSGHVVAEDIARLTARCDATSILELVAEEAHETARPKRPRNTVVSLVKHRMKRAGYTSARDRLRQSS